MIIGPSLSCIHWLGFVYTECHDVILHVPAIGSRRNVIFPFIATKIDPYYQPWQYISVDRLTLSVKLRIGCFLFVLCCAVWVYHNRIHCTRLVTENASKDPFTPNNSITVTVTLTEGSFEVFDGHCDEQNELHTHFACQRNVCNGDGVARCEQTLNFPPSNAGP